jgi:NAD(P)-dependent dehydrogenase (short-subunit alcohol dehydrogenase family)
MSSALRNKRLNGSKALSVLGKTALSAAAVIAARRLLSATVRRELDLRDKVVLITGGSRGLGLALAREFGTQGSRIAVCARDSNELNEACMRLGKQGIDATPFTCDISDHSEVQLLVERVIHQFGRIDILINNAGFIKVGPLDSFTDADFEYAMKVMFWAPVNVTFAVLPHMRTQRSGHIVNITSIGGRVSVPHLLPYACAKFALVGFSTGLSTELKSHGIHVLTVVPGLMRTGSYLNAEFTGAAKEEFALFSLLGNLPPFSVAADYAAACVRRALEKQRYTCTISVPAKLLIAAEALLPETTRAVIQLVNAHLLPRSEQTDTVLGKVLNSRFGKLFHALTTLGRQAALRYNE